MELRQNRSERNSKVMPEKIIQLNGDVIRGKLKILVYSNAFSSVWYTDSLDWKNLSASEITKRVTGKVQSGSICLFHNAALHTPEALPSIIEYFRNNGYIVVPISKILLDGEYYMDHTGKQCPAL